MVIMRKLRSVWVFGTSSYLCAYQFEVWVRYIVLLRMSVWVLGVIIRLRRSVLGLGSLRYHTSAQVSMGLGYGTIPLRRSVWVLGTYGTIPLPASVLVSGMLL